jgi:RND family efflux transporter MFP subunit
MNEQRNEPSGPTRTTQGKSKTAKYLPLAIIPVILIGGLVFRNRQNATPSAGAGGNAAGGAAGGGRGAQAATVYKVDAVPVSLGNVVQTLPVTGQLRTNQNIDLQSKISGRVARVLVQEGQRIRLGQLLVELDDADLRAQVAAQQAAVRTAQVRLEQSIVGLPAREQQVSTNIQQAEAALATAQARYRQALLTEPARVTEAENLVSTARETVRTAQARVRQARETASQTNLQTAAEIRQAQSQLESARSGVAAARSGVAREEAALAEVRRGAREQQIAQAQSQVNLAEAQARNAETELNRARILAQGGAAPQSEVDRTQTAFQVANAQLENARQNLSLVREGATNEQVRQAQERVRSAEEAVRQSQSGVTQAQAALQNAQAGRSRVLVAQGEITTSLAALSQAQSGLQNALANLSQIPITRQETRVAREAVEQARAQLSQARANRSQIPVARSDVQAARAALQTAQAGLQQARVNLAYAKIYSPVNGVVNQKLTDVGETAGAATALLNLVSLDRVYFEAQVSELQVRDVRAGQPAQITVPAVSDRPLRAYVSDVIPTANEQSRQFRVRISIPSAPRQLTPGAFARGVITTQQVSGALVVPNNAVRQSDGQSFLLVAVPSGTTSQVKRRNVVAGPASGGVTQIRSGVRQGDLVITGNQDLEDGDKVEVEA